MQDGLSLGRALPKNKSINVEANILDEWKAERQLVTDRIRVRAIGLVTCFALAVLAVPLANSFDEKSQAAALKARSERELLDKKLQVLEATGQQAQPMIAFDQMVEREHANARAMLGNLILIFNAAPNKVAVSKIKAAVTGGEASIELSADSEDSESAKAFAADAAKGPGTIYSVLASTKKSTVLSADGLGFDIDKKVSVKQ